MHTAARRMIRIVQDIDTWLGDCAATVEHDNPDGTRFVTECTLPAGHHGPHQDGSVLLTGARLVAELRDLADAAERTGHNFGWTAPDIDRDLTGVPGTTASSHDLLANLAASLDTIRHRTARLAADVRDICAGLADQNRPAEPATTDRRATGADRSLSVE